MVEPKSPGNLLWAPRHTPASVLPPPLPLAFPRHRRARNRKPARDRDGTGQPVRHMQPQSPGSSSASRLSGDAPPAPHAIVQSLPGNPGCRPGSPRFAAALARPSMALAPGGVRSRAPQGPAPTTAPSPPAPQMTDTALTAAPTSATNETAPSRPPHETTGNRPAEIPPPPSPRPRLKALRPPQPRTAADAPAAPLGAAPAIAACHAKPVPNAAEPPSHIPLPPRCCDDRLNPPPQLCFSACTTAAVHFPARKSKIQGWHDRFSSALTRPRLETANGDLGA